MVRSVVLCFLLVAVLGMVVDAFQRPARVVVRGLKMAVDNDAFAKKNREMRVAGAGDRVVELRMPFGMELDEDQEGNVYVKEILPKSFAEKSGKVFVGDRVAMVQAVFGEDMWSVRGAGLTRVVSCIKLRNRKPTKLVFEAATEAEEKKRRAIAYAEASEEEKKRQAAKAVELLSAMNEEDKNLLKKRKGFLGLW